MPRGRYAGHWFEVARTPNPYEKQCASNVALHYTLESEGKIKVLNECRTAAGKQEAAHAHAAVVDQQTHAKLKVSFLRPFYYKSWIVAVSPDYSWALVTNPDRGDVWVLSRTPRLEAWTYDHIREIAQQNGVAIDRLVRTPQIWEQGR